MRYEPQPNKNVLGYWTNADDWADWEFRGRQRPACTKSKSSKAAAQAAAARKSPWRSTIRRLTFTVQDTGHFQHMIQRTIGEVKLATGKHTLAVKPQTKPGAAVMDLRRVVLRPAQSGR